MYIYGEACSGGRFMGRRRRRENVSNLLGERKSMEGKDGGQGNSRRQ